MRVIGIHVCDRFAVWSGSMRVIGIHACDRFEIRARDRFAVWSTSAIFRKPSGGCAGA